MWQFFTVVPAFRGCNFYSHSIVPTGLGVRSYSTRQTPGTSAKIRWVHGGASAFPRSRSWGTVLGGHHPGEAGCPAGVGRHFARPGGHGGGGHGNLLPSVPRQKAGDGGFTILEGRISAGVSAKHSPTRSPHQYMIWNATLKPGFVTCSRAVSSTRRMLIIVSEEPPEGPRTASSTLGCSRSSASCRWTSLLIGQPQQIHVLHHPAL